MPEYGLHRNKVNDSLEALLGPDGNLDRKRGRTQHVVHLAHHLKEVCAGAVHLVDISDTGHIVLVGLTPYGLRLGFYAAHGAESSHGAVKHTERTLHFHSEVNVSRSVDKVDFELVVLVFPERRGCGGSDCDSALLLLLHPVHGGSAVMHLADLVGKTGIEEDTLRSSGFSGIDVSHDADVSCEFKLVVFSHFLYG